MRFIGDEFIKKFYDNTKFHHFRDISDEEIFYLREYALKIQGELKKRYRTYARRHGEYIDTIDYLEELEENKTITFDQKIFLFIFLMDPHLKIYDIFNKKRPKSDEEISLITDKFSRNHLIQERIRNNREIEKTLTQVLGCSDKKIIPFEESFYKNILYRNNPHITFNKNLIEDIITAGNNITSLDDISVDRFNVLMNYAQEIRDKLNKLPREILSYIIAYQMTLLDIQIPIEQVVLFLAIIDSEFHLLEIFEEESNYHQIKSRAIEELTFYDKSMIAIEKMILKRFYPNKKEVNWLLLRL